MLDIIFLRFLRMGSLQMALATHVDNLLVWLINLIKLGASFPEFFLFQACPASSYSCKKEDSELEEKEAKRKKKESKKKTRMALNRSE